MKKLLLLTALGVAAFTAQAAESTYTVYDNGTWDSANLTFANWYNLESDFNAAPPAELSDVQKVLKFSAGAANLAAASGGFWVTENVEISGPLSTATLHFNWYQEGTATYTIRLTGGVGAENEYDSPLTEISGSNIAPDTWNEASINIQQAFPELAKSWETAAEVNNFYVFAVVITNGSEGDALYLSNIYYDGLNPDYVKPAPPVVAQPENVPVPTQSEADVLSIYSDTYPAATTFNFGQWGSTTIPSTVSIAGKNVYMVKNFNYFGWELISDLNVSGYNYLHVDYWTPNGTSFGITPVTQGGSPTELLWAATSVEQNQWNSYNIPLSYYEGLNLADVFQIKFDNGNGSTGYIANVYFYKSDDSADPGTDVPGDDTGNGESYTGYETGTYEGGDLNGSEFKIDYTATWNEDGTVTFAITVDPVTTGLVPQINYNVSIFKNFEGTSPIWNVTTNDTFTEGESPFSFYFSYAGGAVTVPCGYKVGESGTQPPSTDGDGDGGDGEGGDGEGGDDIVGNGNTFAGEQIEATMGNVSLNIDWSATWNENAKVTFNITIETDSEVVGLSPQLFVNGAREGDFQQVSRATSNWTYTTLNAYPEDSNVTFALFIASQSGVTEHLNLDYKIGSSNTSSGGDDNGGDDNGDDDDIVGTGASYSGTISGTFTGAKLNDADEPSDIDFKAAYVATWNQDGTVTIELTVNPVVVGLVPQLNVGSEYQRFEGDNGSYSYTTANQYKEGEEPFSILFAYADSGVTVELPYSVGASGNDGSSAIQTVGNADNEAAVEYFDLQGRKVNNPQNGIFIRRQGSKTSKVIIK